MLTLMGPPLLAGIVSAGVLMVLLRSELSLPLDQPNDRSLHRDPTPRIGGVGVMAGIVAGWTTAFSHVSPWLLTATLLLALISLVDDVRELPVLFRLLAHFLAAAAAALFIIDAGLRGGFAPPAQGIAVTAFLIVALVWMTNLFNFMDGADGLAGGMALFGFGCYGLAALSEGDPGMAAMAFSVAAAAGGFLVFNFPPARVFLGDCGSIPLGFLAGTLGLLGWQSALWPAWFPLITFSPFIVDATITLLLRIARGERFWCPHYEHYYQHLVRMGWGHRKLAVSGYLLMALVGGIALATRKSDEITQLSALAGVALIYSALAVWLTVRWKAHLRGRHP